MLKEFKQVSFFQFIVLVLTHFDYKVAQLFLGVTFGIVTVIFQAGNLYLICNTTNSPTSGVQF